MEPIPLIEVIKVKQISLQEAKKLIDDFLSNMSQSRQEFTKQMSLDIMNNSGEIYDKLQIIKNSLDLVTFDAGEEEKSKKTKKKRKGSDYNAETTVLSDDGKSEKKKKKRKSIISE